MSSSLYQATNNFGTDEIFNYFDLTGTLSIDTRFAETNTDNQKLKSNDILNSNLKHFGTIGYKISSVDIATQYVPKCYINTNNTASTETASYAVPTITKRIVFILQAPGGFGHAGSSSPNNNGGGGGAGACAYAYLDRSINAATNISVTLTTPTSSTQTSSTVVFTGGTSVTLTCTSGAPGAGTNVGGAGGTVAYSPTSYGITSIATYTANNGDNSDKNYTSSPLRLNFNTTTQQYYPLAVNDAGVLWGTGGPGGGYGGNGSQGYGSLFAVWFLI